MPQAKILCVCRDQAVKTRRCMALTAEGYETVGTTVIKHAAQLLASESFDLLVIGLSFPDHDRQWLASLSMSRYHVPSVLAFEGKATDEGEQALRNKAASLLRTERRALAATASR